MGGEWVVGGEWVIMAPSYLQVLAAVVAVRAAGNDDLAAWQASCYYIPGSRAFYMHCSQ